jgi:hypothetical protein
MDIHAADLDKNAAIQYVALALIEEHVRNGKLTGDLPQKMLGSKERKLLKNILEIHPFSDIEVEAAYVAVLGGLMQQGYQIEGSNLLDQLRGEVQ